MCLDWKCERYAYDLCQLHSKDEYLVRENKVVKTYSILIDILVLYSLKYGRRFLDEVLSSFKKISHLPSALYLQRNIYIYILKAIVPYRMGRNGVSERASFFGKIYRRERYPKEMIYISRWNNPHQWSFVMHLLLFPLCASSWRDFRRYLLLYVVASEETHYFQNKPCLPSTLRYCSTPAATLLIKQTLFQYYVVLGISYLSV